MYQTFRIQNFRAFEDLTFHDLARVNLIAGKNNVGKTAVLEAIVCSLGRFDALLSRQIALRRYPEISEEMLTALFYRFRTQTSIVFSGIINFPARHEQQEVSFTIDKIDSFELSQIDSEFDSRRISGRRVDDLSQGVRVSHGGIRLTSDIFCHQLYVVVGDDYLTRSEVLPTFVFGLGNRGDEEETGFSGLKKRRKEHLLIDILKPIEPRLKEITLLNTGLHCDLEGVEQLVPLALMGDGFIRVLRLALGIISARNGVALIDEIENGLHHSVQRQVWDSIARLSRDFNVQIFATTHSDETLHAAHEAFADDPDALRYYRLDRSVKTVKISAVTYDPETLAGVVEFNLEVRG